LRVLKKMGMSASALEKKSLEYRMDGRDRPEFLNCIDDGTDRENRLMEIWAKQPGILGYKGHAKGRDGKLLKRSNADADFVVTTRGFLYLPDGTHLVEVKPCPCLWKATFKKSDLESYYSQGAYILTIWGQGRDNPMRWALIEPSAISRILFNYKDEVSTEHNGMGGKPAILILERDFPKYFGPIQAWRSCER
jgi:hypothetical protein